MVTHRRIIPIYTTRGDVGAYLVFPYLYNKTGEWIGWVTQTREVYSVLGHYVGWLSDDPRILRKRAQGFSSPRVNPPPRPGRIQVPVTVPLPSLMSELSYSTIDVLDEEPERLSTVDSDDLREDMD